MPDEPHSIRDETTPEPPRPLLWRRRSVPLVAGLTGLAMLVVGAVAGAGATRMMASRDIQPLLPPAAISAMADDSVVAFKGKVAEIFGNKFVVEDASGRALVETGRAGEGGGLVAKDETVTVQGRFDDGFVHGSTIVHGDGRTDVVGPAGGPPPHHHLKDWLRRP